MAVGAGGPVSTLNSATDATSYATGSWTPTNNRLFWLFVENSVTSGGAVRPTVTGNGLTWEFVHEYYAGTNDGMALFVAMNVGSVGTVGTTTLNFGGVTQLGCEAMIVETDGSDLPLTLSSALNYVGFVGGGGGGSVVNTATMPTGGLSPWAVQPLVADSRCIGAIVISANVALSASAPWTKLSDAGHNTPTRRMMTCWRSDAVDSSFTATWTGTVFDRALFVEILTRPRLPAQAVNASVAAVQRAAAW